MEQKITLTWRQKLAYARWQVKDLILVIPAFPFILVYMGLMLWFSQPYVNYYINNPPEHWLFWQAVARLTCVFGSMFLGWITVYVIYFLRYFFDHNENDQRYFLKYHYKKKTIWTL